MNESLFARFCELELSPLRREVDNTEAAKYSNQGVKVNYILMNNYWLNKQIYRFYFVLSPVGAAYDGYFLAMQHLSLHDTLSGGFLSLLKGWLHKAGGPSATKAEECL
mgnify:CR=1 FL=1